MKLIGQLISFIFFLIIVGTIFAFSYLGMVPYLSTWLGTNKPRDLGIKYTEEDRIVGHAKSGITYTTLPASTPDELSIQRFGSHKVNDTWTSAQITALMNNRPWKNWPYKNVQVKFNGDGSAEISGELVKSKVPGYGAAIAAPKQALELVMKILPADPVFYLKMKASLKDNKVDVFEPQVFQIGRVPIPIQNLLAFQMSLPSLVKPVEAAFTFSMLDDLAKVHNKKDLIILFINNRISTFKGFYATKALFTENKLIFDGSLADKEATVR